MRVLLTGHQGYLGTLASPMLAAAGHEVVGLDSGLYADCILGDLEQADPPSLAVDLRDVTVDQLAGFDAVIHLAALSNDPLGSLAPEHTYDINHHASTRLARLAKEAETFDDPSADALRRPLGKHFIAEKYAPGALLV